MNEPEQKPAPKKPELSLDEWKKMIDESIENPMQALHAILIIFAGKVNRTKATYEDISIVTDSLHGLYVDMVRLDTLVTMAKKIQEEKFDLRETFLSLSVNIQVLTERAGKTNKELQHLFNLLDLDATAAAPQQETK